MYTKKEVDNIMYNVVYTTVPNISFEQMDNKNIPKYKNLKKKTCNKKYIKKNVQLNKKTKKMLNCGLSGDNTDNLKSLLNSNQIVEKKNTSLFNSSVIRKHENETKSTQPHNSLIGKIWVRDPSTMMNEFMLQKFNIMFGKSMNPINENLSNIAPLLNYTSNNSFTSIEQLSICIIENIYKKYISSKNVQNNIIILANILNIILISNKHYKERMLQEPFKNSERANNAQLHSKQNNDLELKFMKVLMGLLSFFHDSDFEITFKIIFLCILSVLIDLNSPAFGKQLWTILRIFVHNNLKHLKLEHSKVFSIINDKMFQPTCIVIINLLEQSRKNDQDLVNRMPLFFSSTTHCQKYFEDVIHVIKNNSEEDLGLLIDNAISKFHYNFIFKDAINVFFNGFL